MKKLEFSLIFKFLSFKITVYKFYVFFILLILAFFEHLISDSKILISKISEIEINIVFGNLCNLIFGVTRDHVGGWTFAFPLDVN